MYSLTRLDIKQVGTSSYEEIATEYYDGRHVTSRNFDSATLAFTNSWQCPISPHGMVLDLGAGKGTVGRYCRLPGERVIQSDVSISMLTLPAREASKARVHCDATALPFAPGSFTAVAAFLFDPYNTPRFFREVGRVLVRGGIFLGTLPHHMWGDYLRKIRDSNDSKACFIHGSGRIIELTSILMPGEIIHPRLSHARLQLLESYDLRLPRSETMVSPDIIEPAKMAGISPYELPIVKFIAARKF